MQQTSGIKRSTTDRVIAGVCSGLAAHLKIDPVLVRLIFVLLAIFGGGGLLAYIVLWIVLPEDTTYIDWKASAGAAAGEQQGETAQADTFTPPPTVERKTSSAQFIGGIILISVGGLFLVASLVPRINFGDLWPVLLIVIGLAILSPALKS
jgi:phage shock protein C